MEEPFQVPLDGGESTSAVHYHQEGLRPPRHLQGLRPPRHLQGLRPPRPSAGTPAAGTPAAGTPAAGTPAAGAQAGGASALVLGHGAGADQRSTFMVEYARALAER